MGKRLAQLTPELIDFIQAQKVFFVGTAAPDGRINVSPKGLDTLKVQGPNEVLWLNLTGSGNETAAHLLESDRMTLMFSAFEGKPLILRLYGHARCVHPRDSEWESLISHFPNSAGARQLIILQFDLVQTSCGFGVPLMAFEEERSILGDWAEKKGDDGLQDYWKEKNSKSLDGKPTGI